MQIKVLGATLLSHNEYDANEYYIIDKDFIWWLRSGVNTCSYKVYCVSSGSVSMIGVNYKHFGVVPALILEDKDIKAGSKITYAGQKFTVLHDGLALSNKIIHHMAFRNDINADDANIYEASDVKKWVDAWFNRNGDTAETVEE